MNREIMDLLEGMDKKLLGIEGILSLVAIGLDVLIKREESYEVSSIQLIHEWIREIRKNDIAILHEMIDNMDDGKEK